MTREEILDTLAAQKKRLGQLRVRELSLFGSYARNEATEGSDLDFLVVFSEKSFDRYMDLKEFLESLFQRPVDLVLESALKPRLRERILGEAIRAA
ncbi:MAG: putative nucleotidyltransferase [Acidobacteria bacterium]|nr:putative nucleotidyltransferase [Acidobacteriota bacterium]